jgi:DNA-binding CsgD family transcriptional regulator/tetratricopeptide (TPR) repeat protein
LHERANNASSLARLHRRLALAEWDRGHFDVAQAHLEAGLQVLAGSEPSAELAELLHVQVILLVRRGDYHGVSAAAQNLATLAGQLGSRRVLAEAYLAQMRSCLMSLVVVDLMAGKWDDALRVSAEVVALTRRLGFVRGLAGALGVRARIHVYHGELDQAAACLAEAHEVFGAGAALDFNIFGLVRAAEMMLALEQRNAAGVLATMERLDQKPMPSGAPLLLLALVAEAQVMVGKLEQALTIAQDFMAHAPPDNAFALALGSRIKGLAQQALGQPSEALFSLDQAMRAFAAVEMPFEAARARLEWATLVAATDTALAVPAAQESLSVFERLGARRYARRFLYKLGVRPRSTFHGRPSATPLSPREREIVQLVVEDLTNAEIAERLIISPRTVTTHLDRIYTRLGINSRTALVRYVIEANHCPTRACSMESPTAGRLGPPLPAR